MVYNMLATVVNITDPSGQRPLLLDHRLCATLSALFVASSAQHTPPILFPITILSLTLRANTHNAFLQLRCRPPIPHVRVLPGRASRTPCILYPTREPA